MEKNAKKDKRGALAALRKSKMYEKELAKLEGQAVMLETGEVHSSGEMLLPQHLGATLLALGNINPTPHVGAEFEPILAALQ